MCDGVANGKLGAGLTETRAILSCGVYGDIEDLACTFEISICGAGLELMGRALALSIFCVVAMLGRQGQLNRTPSLEGHSYTCEYSHIAGRNFSWISHILGLRLAEDLVPMTTDEIYNSAGFTTVRISQEPEAQKRYSHIAFVSLPFCCMRIVFLN